MKVQKLFPIISLILLTLSGCAGGPVFKEYVKTVPPLKQGEGRVWFYRPSALGTAVQPAVRLNEVAVGKAEPLGFFYADRPAGIYTVKVTTEWPHSCQITLAPQSEKYVKLNMMMGLFVGHVIPKEVDQATALSDLEELHLND